MQENQSVLKYGRIVLGVLLVGISLFGATLWVLLNAELAPWTIRLAAGVIFLGSIIVSWGRTRT